MEVTIDKVAFRIFGIEIMWYAIIICFGILMGLYVATKNAKLRKIKEDEISNMLMFALPASIIGARIYYVAFRWEIYKNDLPSIFNIREGGIAIYGAVIASVIVVYFFGKARKINYVDLLDVCSPGLILGQAIGRWGNFINQEAHGTETNFPIAVIIDGKRYHATFLYESIGNFLIFSFLMIYIRKWQKKKGEVFILYVTLYGLLRFFVEGLRTDSLMFLGFRISQILGILGFVGGIIAFILNRKYGKDI